MALSREEATVRWEGRTNVIGHKAGFSRRGPFVGQHIAIAYGTVCEDALGLHPWVTCLPSLTL